MDEEIGDIKNANVSNLNQSRKKPSILRKVVISSSNANNSIIVPTTTQIGHDFDPEKRKDSKKHYNV